MRIMRGLAAAVAVLLAAPPLGAGQTQAATCESLANTTVGDATVTAAEEESPSFSIKDTFPSSPVSPAAPFCRAQGSIKPTYDSAIRFELWLPLPSAWNGKYEGVGNGGFAGSITYTPMGRALAAGYTVAGTDTGHVAQGTDARWALGHPEKVTDFGWRAIHETAVVSKAIVQIYYGRAPQHAYFAGCSDGGREALMEAQRFPEDYDGIVVAAPANDWTRLLAAAAWSQQALLAEPGGALSARKLPAISDAALVACHGEDGMLEDPSRCRFDPSALLCKGSENDSCLTRAQVTTLQKIYSGPRDPAGASVFPGLMPGSEAGPAGWSLWVTGTGANPGEGSLMLAFSRGFFGYMVFGDPVWDVRSLNFGEDLKITDAKTAAALNASDTYLGGFSRLGGKLIQYHGWDDSAISAMDSVRYYESVAHKLGGVERAQSFYRLFMAPGMQHCGGGDGPNAVGGPFGLPAPARDPEHDVVAALAHWVEDGVAPQRIVATKYRDDDPAKGIARQRPWCPYPAVARYSGQGSRNDAASFTCAAPPSSDR
jgi:Tannase and feruloyl esterase